MKGDERIRTAVPAPGADSAYERHSSTRLEPAFQPTAHDGTGSAVTGGGSLPAALLAKASDALDEAVRQMSDSQLRGAIEAIRGNPKRAGSKARRLDMAESVALAALMAEEARRVRA